MRDVGFGQPGGGDWFMGREAKVGLEASVREAVPLVRKIRRGGAVERIRRGRKVWVTRCVEVTFML